MNLLVLLLFAFAASVSANFHCVHSIFNTYYCIYCLRSVCPSANTWSTNSECSANCPPKPAPVTTTTKIPESSTTTAPLPPSWYEAADFIKNQINQRVSPCDDFYNFSCGQWNHNSKFPGPNAIFQDLDQRNFKITQENIISEKYEVPENLKQVRDKIIECSEYTGNAKLLAEEMQKFGVFPLFAKKAISESYMNYHGLFSRYGVDPFYQPDISPNVCARSTNKTLWIKAARLLYGPPEYYQDAALRATFKMLNKLILKTYAEQALALNPAAFGPDIDKVAATLVDLEQELASIQASTAIKSKKYANFYPFKRHDFEAQFPAVNASEFFPALEQSEGACILAADPRYLRSLEKVLQKFSKEDIKNYAMLKFIYAYGEPVLYMKPTLNTCVHQFHHAYPFAVGWFFQNGNVDNDAFDRLFANLKLIFYNYISSRQGIDAETTEKIRKKFQDVVAHIARPKVYENSGLFNKKLNGLNISGMSWLAGATELRKFAIQQKMSNIGGDFNRENLEFSPLHIAESYSANENSFVLPEATIKKPFFYKDGPNYINYAAIGTITANLFAQTLDSNGARFGNFGQLENIYDELSLSHLQNSVKTLGAKFENFCEEGVCLNGHMQADTNFLDEVALWSIFRGYQDLARKTGEEPRLPGLEQYTPEQMFFINYAKSFCGNTIYDAMANKVNIYSPPKWRIHGLLSGNAVFKKVFNCAATST